MENRDGSNDFLDSPALHRNLNLRVVLLASKISQLIQRRALRPAGVVSQEYRLMMLLAVGGPCHLRELARRSAYDASHVSRTLAAMIRKGWVQRRPSGSDQRKVVFDLTAEGRDLFDGLFPESTRLADEMAASIACEAETVRRAMDALLAHCDQELRDGAAGR